MHSCCSLTMDISNSLFDIWKEIIYLLIIHFLIYKYLTLPRLAAWEVNGCALRGKQSLISPIALKRQQDAGTLSLVRSFFFAFFPQKSLPRNNTYVLLPSTFIYTAPGREYSYVVLKWLI